MSDDKPWLFKSGNPGGPGRPVTPEDIREAARFGRVNLAREIITLLGMDWNQLGLILKNKDGSGARLACARILAIAIQNGDTKRMNWLVEQAFGKLPQNFNIAAFGDSKKVGHQDIMGFLRDLREKRDSQEASDTNGDS